MCTRNQALDIFSQAYRLCSDLFADKLTDAYLYGSYARGDFDEESDIDVMIIADISPSERENVKKELSDYIYDLDLEYDVLLSVFIQDNATYERYKTSYPFYKNIEKEGVDLVA